MTQCEAGCGAGEAGVAAGGAVEVERGGWAPLRGRREGIGEGVFLGGEGDEVTDAAGFEAGGGLEEVEFEVDVAAYY